MRAAPLRSLSPPSLAEALYLPFQVAPCNANVVR